MRFPGNAVSLFLFRLAEGCIVVGAIPLPGHCLMLVEEGWTEVNGSLAITASINLHFYLKCSSRSPNDRHCVRCLLDSTG